MPNRLVQANQIVHSSIVMKRVFKRFSAVNTGLIEKKIKEESVST